MHRKQTSKSSRSIRSPSSISKSSMATFARDDVRAIASTPSPRRLHLQLLHQQLPTEASLSWAGQGSEAQIDTAAQPHRSVTLPPVPPLRQQHLDRRCSSRSSHVPVTHSSLYSSSQCEQPTELQRLPPKHRCMEAKLFGLLKQLPPDVRRRLLSTCFTEAQRLALERWILAHRRAALTSSQSCKQAMADRSRDLQNDVVAPCGTKKRKQCSSAGEDLSANVGLHRQRRHRRILYRAGAVVGPFRVMTGYSEDLVKARRHLEVVLRIRDRMRGCNAFGDTGTLERRFSDACREEPSALGLHAHELQLRFYAAVPAKYWVGRNLNTPCFSAVPGDGLEAGLLAWRRLSGARSLVYRGRSNRHTMLRRHDKRQLEVAWRTLRQTYLDIWAETGRRPQDVAARLCALETKRRQHSAAPGNCPEPWASITSRAMSVTRPRCVPSRAPGVGKHIVHSAEDEEFETNASSIHDNNMISAGVRCTGIQHQILALLLRWTRQKE